MRMLLSEYVPSKKKAITNKDKLQIVKLTIVSDLILDHDYYSDHEIKPYTNITSQLAEYTTEEVFLMYMSTMLETVYEAGVMQEKTYITDCSESFKNVIKYVSLQQKVDIEVLLNYCKFLLLQEKKPLILTKKSINYISNFKKSNHIYNLTGKSENSINFTLDKSLKNIIDLELTKHEINL